MKKIFIIIMLASVLVFGGCSFGNFGGNETPSSAPFPSVSFEPETENTSGVTENQTNEPPTAPAPSFPGEYKGKTAKGNIISVKDGITYIDGILVVNKTYSLPEGYDPGGLTEECAAAFDEMARAAASEGVELWALSGFRSYETQKGLYERYCASDGQDAADRYSARPGHSEHQTGLAIDVNSVVNSFKDTFEGEWLALHCPEYGFILRYPEGKEAQTGYIYEPWHVRYLGDRSLAREITDSGLSLEEYFGIDSVY